MTEEARILLEVKSDERFTPLTPVFSNFVQISRVATDVQFEFLFVDINTVATSLQKAGESSEGEPIRVQGMPVAKLVMPALSFIQVKDHLNHLFEDIEKAFGKLPRAKEA